jgi:hypothetical protein
MAAASAIGVAKSIDKIIAFFRLPTQGGTVSGLTQFVENT